MCTIFKVTENLVTLVGNNEDYSDSGTKIWFLAPVEGKHGRVYFGYKNGWAQGGMNEHGLFFDWVSGYQEEWVSSADKIDYAGNLSEKILEEASSLVQVVEMYHKYNEPSFSFAKAMYVDRSGASAVIGYENGQLHIQYGDNYQTLGFAAHIANAVLSDMDTTSVSSCENILKSCLQTGEYPTQYTNIYNLFNLDLYVYDFHESNQCYKFNLMDELQKGSHCFDIHQLDSQLHSAFVTDYKSEVSILEPVTFADEHLHAYTGTYQLTNELQIDIKSDHGLLYATVVNSSDGSKLGLTPRNEREWYISSFDAKLTFQGDWPHLYNQLIIQGGITSDSSGESNDWILTRLD